MGQLLPFFYNVPVSSINDSVWLSARALGPNGVRSLRQNAFHYSGSLNGQDCYVGCGSVGHDAGISEVTNPGDFVENCDGLATTIDVTLELENIGLFPESNFDIYYQLDGNPPVSETYTNVLASGGTATFVFATPISIQTSGTYILNVWTALTNDDASCNDTITQTINVQYPSGTFPFTEDFESGSFPPSTGTIQNDDGEETWTEIAANGPNGGAPTTAMYVENFVYNANGEEDIFKMIPIDLSQVVPNSDLDLTFDIAYKRYSATYFDGLRIDISVDCGQTFSQIYYKEGTVLATGPDLQGAFSPIDEQDWRNDTVDLSSYIGSLCHYSLCKCNGLWQ